MKPYNLVFAAAAFAAILSGCAGGSDTPPPSPNVTAATPLVSEVADWDEYVGRFEATKSVEVRPRATGYLSAVHFSDGQFVKKGQLLFTVDARPAKASLDQARAQLAQAEAELTNAKTQLARSKTLSETGAASQEELEEREATMRSAAAQVAAAKATVRARELDVSFTRVTAPISGRISERLVDPGNTVVADNTILTTIVSVNPLHFTFQGSEAQLLKYQRDDTGTSKGAAVRIRLADENEFRHHGTVDFVDNAVSVGGGTIRVRALVPNADGFLKPGMFGNLRLEASKPYAALLVPDEAIVADASRKIVYVVGKDGAVEAKEVQLGPISQGLRVIRSGLTKEDRVIIAGVQRARPGQQVTAKDGKIAPSDKAPAPSANTAPPAAAALPASAS